MLKLKRVYDPVSHTDGTRVLGERLWPRGLSKAKLQVSAWLKDAGPGTELRKWFSHDPEKWSRFRTRYFRDSNHDQRRGGRFCLCRQARNGDAHLQLP